MGNFTKFMGLRRTDVNIDNIAKLMVQRNVNPHWYIECYLESMSSPQSPPGLLLEGWMGSFFKRIGNAWNAFWKSPDEPNSAEEQLEVAKKALESLVQTIQQNQSAEGNTLPTILLGLQQALSIVAHLEPQIKQLNTQIQSFQKGETGPNDDPMHQLPDDLNKKFLEIMTRQDAIVKEPDSPEKAQKLVQTDNELNKFKQELENTYQQMNPNDPDPEKQEYKKKLGNFLKRVDTDATFREVQSLINFARKRTSTGMLASRPDGSEEVKKAFEKIKLGTQDPEQQREQLIAWYAALHQAHPLRKFIQGEMKKSGGTDENAMFYNYAYNWINNYPHHMAR